MIIYRAIEFATLRIAIS